MDLNRQKIILGLSVAVAIETGIGSGTVSLTNAIPADWIPIVKTWMNLLAFIGSTIVSTLTGMSIASAPTPPKGAVLLALIIGGSFLACDRAEAQNKLTGNLIRDIGNATVVSPLRANDPFGDLMSQIEKVKAEQIEGIVAALKEADADAGTVINTATNDVKDPIAHACYPAQIKFLQSLPVSQPIASPAPFNLIVLFQRKRDFVAQVKAGIPAYLKLGCSALLGDEVQTFVQTTALVGIKLLPAAATAMFPPLAPVTLPAMTLLP